MNTTIDLITLIESDLGQGRRSGRWTMFHCPFPEHKHGDRKPSLAVFNGQDSQSAWWKCFGCRRHGGSIKWLMEYREMSYRDALSALSLPTRESTQSKHFEPPIQQPYPPPAEIWQARARIIIKRYEEILWSEQGKEARAWLHARGLNDDTIRAARLGFIPNRCEEPSKFWGNPRNDSSLIFLPSQCILIPGLIAGKVWYLKYRQLHPRDPNKKYFQVRGSQPAALYLADHLAHERPAVFCEGEFDALLLRQEIQDLASVITLGSATNDLNLATWGLYLLRPSSFILAYDTDQAGASGNNKLTWLSNAHLLTIPQLQPGDKDLTDFHKSGGHLRSLIENALHPDAPIYVTWSVNAKPATVDGQYWRRPDERIEAFYTPDQLEYCLGTMRAAPLDEVPI